MMPTNQYENFCPLPFTQMTFHPSGKVTPCCWLSDYELGNIKSQSVLEIWNGDKISKLRREFIRGVPEVCKKNMECSHCNYHHFEMNKFVELEEFQKKSLKRMDIMMNGKCNARCIMCSNWKLGDGVYTSDIFRNKEWRKMLGHLLEIEVYGGEPFIQDDVFRLVREVGEINSECCWMFTTNGNYHLDEKKINLLNGIKIKSIAISIDSLCEEVFCQIRKGVDFNKTLNTLDGLIGYNDSLSMEKHFKILINVVVQQKNCMDITSIIEFAEEKGVGVFPYLLESPVELSLGVLETSKKLEIIEHYIKKNHQLKSIVLLELTQLLLKTIPKNEGIKTRLAFIELFEKLSQKRKE